MPRCSREEVGSPGLGRPIGGCPAIASARSAVLSSAMAASLAARRSVRLAKVRRASRPLPHADEAHASWRAAAAACSSRALNRARPGVEELEVTGASVALLLDGLRIANALGN